VRLTLLVCTDDRRGVRERAPGLRRGADLVGQVEAGQPGRSLLRSRGLRLEPVERRTGVVDP
jgi:hypothetical protein